MNLFQRGLITFSIVFSLVPGLRAQESSHSAYSEMVQQSEPIAFWNFDSKADQSSTSEVPNAMEGKFSAKKHGAVKLSEPGPRPSIYPDFSKENLAAGFPRGGNYLVVSDPGEKSPLDFTNGDALTLEAWVRMESDLTGTYPYIIGKGRTHNAGTNHNNQNYALRLAKKNGGTMISFFFVDETGKKNSIEAAGHRWTSTTGVPDDGDWHHVAITYEFGKPKSIHGYVDGEPVAGKWDMAGPTTLAPFVDDDELWIGSAMGGTGTLNGQLDEVAIYRHALTSEQIKSRVDIRWEESPFSLTTARTDAPSDHVRVEILEGLSTSRSWKFRMKEAQLLYETDRFAMNGMPHKYNAKGLIIDHKLPALVHMMTKIKVEGGTYEFLLRSLDGARLYVDGKPIAETQFMTLNTSAHQGYYELAKSGDDLLSIAAGHYESRATIELTPGEHVVSLYRQFGLKGKGAYIGELTAAMAKKGEPFQFISPQRELPYTDAGWIAFQDEEFLRRRDWEQKERAAKSQKERAYWTARHQWAKEFSAENGIAVPNAQPEMPANNAIDHFINAKLADEDINPRPLTSDWEFLRRVCLDATGLIPNPEQVDTFFALPQETRRETFVQSLIDSPDRADHWVSYWQDALAENPGLTKPELNNTGPFRWYLHESFLDNKPFDRFVTELVMMEGSAYSGGPAGFGVASQNDVPMAAKAHIIGTAFLAVEMKCARCHDAPYHDIKQEDLFSLAASLKRAPQKVPGSSTIPATPEELEKLVVKVTLQPGTDVKPAWPFVEFVSTENDESAIPESLIRNANDSREQLAAQITSPKNERFACVIVNRLWTRFLGRGLVNNVDDWEEVECSHPELLDYLAQEFTTHGYDLKHIEQLIFNSNVYQRQVAIGVDPHSERAAFFEGPILRKMSGEQLADSLYRATGKPFESEKLTMDADGKQSNSRFGHLGSPRRSWEFVSVSNERDRPSMSLPVAQSVVDLMSAYGWRAQRQEPKTVREDPLTALQPMALANGTSAQRAIDFSDHSALTKLALEEQTVEAFVEALYERLLTRPPTSDERQLFSEMLKDGYESRVIAGPEAVPAQRLFRSGITWINHFHPKADNEAIARQREILKGDPASVRLEKDWRIRAEDAVWAIVNSPEFVFIP